MILSIADDDLFLEHECPPGHPERADRLRAARLGSQSATSGSEFQIRYLPPRDPKVDEVVRVHPRGYLERLLDIRGKRGYLDADTFFSPRSYEATFRACGAAVALVESVLEGEAQHGFGLVRPPGHHACVARAMGFCIINHAAVAARHAQSLGARRVLILDWDVHHGNGTEDVFWKDATVLYSSLHESPQYPGTGPVEAVGLDAGRGFTVNLPLSAGATDVVYADAFWRVVLPVVSSFAPDLVIVSAGYDAHARDPLGGMALTDAAYGWMTAQLRRALPGTPIVFLLEGGYDLSALEGAVAATLQGLVGDEFELHGGLSQRHELELDAAVDVHRRHWAL
jgi:acetoin utilization deacetylase AcuC-like enzyme